MNADNLKKEIKKVKIGHIALLCAGIFVAFAIIGSILLAVGGAWTLRNNGGIHLNITDIRSIGPGKLYEVNDRGEQVLDGIDKVVVTGVESTITVRSGGDRAVAELVGQCRSTADPVKLETRVQGSTLIFEVKYPLVPCSSSTELTVTLPESYVDDLSVSAVSGSIVAEGLPFQLKQVTLSTVSGHIDFSTASLGRLKANTTSGNINVTGIAGEVTANTVSGRITLDYASFAATTVGTVSGDVNATLPGDATFKVNFDSVSGTFLSRHPNLDVQGASRGFSGAAAGGTTPFKVNTTSGSFRIEGK